MKPLPKIVLASAFAVALSAGAAHGIVLQQTFSLPTTITDITGTTGTGTFDYWQTEALQNGLVLANVQLISVQLRISVTERITALSITNNDVANQHTYNYVTFSNISVVGTAPAADKTSLNSALDVNAGGTLSDIDLFLTGPVLFNPSQTINFVPPIVTKIDDSTALNAAAIAAYDTTGQFTLGFTTLTSQSFIGGGGNSLVNQATDAAGTVQVIYNYIIIPAPGSAALLGLGGLIAARRRRA